MEDNKEETKRDQPKNEKVLNRSGSKDEQDENKKGSISPEGNTKTLKEIIHVIGTKLCSFKSESDKISASHVRMEKGISKIATQLKQSHYERPSSFPPGPETQQRPPLCAPLDLYEDENVSAWRKNVELQLTLREVQQQYSAIRTKCSEKVDEDVKEQMMKLKQVLEIHRVSLSATQKMIEKLFNDFHLFKADNPLPEGLQLLCDRISGVVGLQYKSLGRALGLDSDTLDRIDFDYKDECFEELFIQIIRQWVKKDKNPTVYKLINACHKTDPNIIKEKPLAKEKVKILEVNMKYLYNEMLDVPVVLPYLFSKGILTLGLQKYVLAPHTKDVRIYHLMDILCTRENGFDEFCNALDDSKQGHIADKLRGAHATEDHTESNTVASCASEGTTALDLHLQVDTGIVSVPTSSMQPQTDTHNKSNNQDGNVPVSVSPMSPGAASQLSPNEVQDVLQKIASLLHTAGIQVTQDRM